MASKLYSAHIAAGKAAGQYKSSLYDITNIGLERGYEEEATEWRSKKREEGIGLVAESLKLSSEAYGGWQEKQAGLKMTQQSEARKAFEREERAKAKSPGPGHNLLMLPSQPYTPRRWGDIEKLERQMYMDKYKPTKVRRKTLYEEAEDFSGKLNALFGDTQYQFGEDGDRFTETRLRATSQLAFGDYP